MLGHATQRLHFHQFLQAGPHKPLKNRPPKPPPQADLLEALYRCARNGRPELHTRFVKDPAFVAAFDELIDKDARVQWGRRAPSGSGLHRL